MSKVVKLKLDGSLELGLQVNLAIAPEAKTREVEISGSLPPAPKLQATYTSWQYNYRSLNLTSRLTAKKITYDGSIQKHLAESLRLVGQLKKELNTWLNSPQFQPIWRKLIEKISTEETVRILIRTADKQLRKLPWHLWELLEQYPYTEIALATNDYEKITSDQRTSLAERAISILAILGDSRGINIAEDREILSKTLTNAELTFLCEPKREEINEQLWDCKWDILFFAGHSQSDRETGRIYLNSEDSLSLEELSYGLKRAVDRGLKLAIFNSCDGLGLASFLESINLPQIIVMREPIPDLVAQQFLKYFLTDFASGKHFYLAVREARERLQGLEDKYPGASWQPIIVQNPGTILPTWQSLAGISEPNSLVVTKTLPITPQYPKISSRRKVLKYGSFILGGISLTAIIARMFPKESELPKFEIEQVKNIQIAEAREIWSLAISADGKFIASGNNTGTIEFFNRQTGDITKILGEHKNVIRALVFIPQTDLLVSGDGDGNIKVWNLENNHQESQLQAHAASIWSLAISPDGQTLISGSEDESIRIWNLETGETKGILFAHNTVVYALAFSADGSIFASAGRDNRLKI